LFDQYSSVNLQVDFPSWLFILPTLIIVFEVLRFKYYFFLLNYLNVCFQHLAYWSDRHTIYFPLHIFGLVTINIMCSIGLYWSYLQVSLLCLYTPLSLNSFFWQWFQLPYFVILLYLAQTPIVNNFALFYLTFTINQHFFIWPFLTRAPDLWAFLYLHSIIELVLLRYKF